MNRPEFSLIIPTYNEAENIVPLLQVVHASLGPISHEIIVVDDDSPDQTWKRVQEFSEKNPWAIGHRRIGERGLSSAVIKGFDLSQGAIIGVMDADLSHDEKILPQLIQKIRDGAVLAIGSRRIKGGGATSWPWYRRMTSSGATWIAKLLLDLPLSDPMSGYFVLQRSLYESCRDRLEPQGYKILLEIYCKSRPDKIAEVPFVFKDRTQGYSKLSGAVMSQYLTMVWKLRASNERARGHRQ